MTSSKSAPPGKENAGKTGKVGKTGKLRSGAACSDSAPPGTPPCGIQFSQFSRFHTPHQKRLERIRSRLSPTWSMGAALEQPDDEDPEDDGVEMIDRAMACARKLLGGDRGR